MAQNAELNAEMAKNLDAVTKAPRSLQPGFKASAARERSKLTRMSLKVTYREYSPLIPENTTHSSLLYTLGISATFDTGAHSMIRVTYNKSESLGSENNSILRVTIVVGATLIIEWLSVTLHLKHQRRPSIAATGSAILARGWLTTAIGTTVCAKKPAQDTKEEAASQVKVDAQRTGELERFFAEQSALQDETRAAFQKYDTDSSGAIDVEELYKLLDDIGAFDDVEESQRKGLCETVIKSNDTDKDGTISFSEFTQLFNSLLTEKGASEMNQYKVPNIFGQELTEEEANAVKACKPMLDRSVFADRLNESASKDYFDTIATRDKMVRCLNTYHCNDGLLRHLRSNDTCCYLPPPRLVWFPPVKTAPTCPSYTVPLDR